MQGSLPEVPVESHRLGRQLKNINMPRSWGLGQKQGGSFAQGNLVAITIRFVVSQSKEVCDLAESS